MATQSRSIVVSIALFALAVFTDCNCKKPTGLIKSPTCASGAPACTVSSDCPDHDDCTNGCCAFGPRNCVHDSDCCPGQTCLADHRCFDQRQECPNGQSDCGDPGTDRVCTTYTNAQGVSDQVCSYAACSATSPCSAGLDCFEGFCVASPPCAGSCPAGTVCLPQTNTCWNYGSDHGCAGVSCMPGYLPMLTNPSNIWDSCNLPAVACQCDELPPLTSTDLGRYSSSTATSDGLIAVSMYDGQYGDLVVQYFTSAGVFQSSDYVDGVPTSGTIVAGPTGPRGGIADPGPDVGKYTSIVTGKDGSLFVSYYDVDNKALKLAIRSPAKTWTTETVDTGGNVGLYTSIALDASGYPAIAYFQEAGTAQTLSCAAGSTAHPDLTTGVKLAHAKSATPAAAADWNIVWVDCAPAPPPPCYGCTSGQTCVGTGQCATASTGCTGCTTSQVCGEVTGTSAASCQTPYTSKPLADIPGGTGLFPSLAFNGSSAVVAYYNRNHKSLMAATGTTTFSPVEMDGNGVGTLSLDTGRYPSVAVSSTSHTISIAYHDDQSRALMYYSTTGALTTVSNPPGTSNIIDPGTSTDSTSQLNALHDGPSFMGASANLHYTSTGKLVVSYQNSTAGDLEFAELETAGAWKVLKSVTPGSVGYFSHVVEVPGASASAPATYVTHAQIHTKLQQNHPITDNSLHVDAVTP